jgi:hypothetical protein
VGASDDYRQSAAECLALAEISADPERYAELLIMALAWFHLAEQLTLPDRVESYCTRDAPLTNQLGDVSDGHSNRVSETRHRVQKDGQAIS